MISIIIPVYNTEKYLARCINSVLCQKHTDWELLLIDDGSTDNSLAICNNFKEKDSRIRVFHQKNKGVSAARNLGIRNSNGDRIVFIDSDDYVTDQYLSDFSFNQDISLQGYYDERGRIRQYKDCIVYKDVGGEFFHQHHIYGPVCKMFKRDIISKNDLYFDPELSYGEDFLFLVRYLFFCKSMHSSSNCNYYYDYSNNTSLSKRRKSYHQAYNMFYKHITAMEILLANSRYFKGIMQMHVWNLYGIFMNSYKMSLNNMKKVVFFDYLRYKYLNIIDRFMLKWSFTYNLHSHIMYQLRKRGIIKS